MSLLTDRPKIIEPLVSERMRYNTLFVRLYALCAGLAFGLGGAFTLGGPGRFQGPNFQGAINLVSWLPWPPNMLWGAMFLCYGLSLVIFMGRPLAIHALRFGVVVYLFLVTSFVGSVWIDSRAAVSGIVAYSAFSIVHLLLSDHLTHRGWEGC